jgi:hypothetical protein
MIPVNQGSRESRRTIKPLCVPCDLCGKKIFRRAINAGYNKDRGKIFC